MNESPTSRMLQVLPKFTRWTETRLSDRPDGMGLSLRQLAALQSVDHEGATLGEVARRLMVTPAVVTGLVDRLERRGFVRRIDSGRDRRLVHLELTDSGQQTREQVSNGLISDVDAAMTNLSSDERRDLERGLDVMDKLVQHLDQERARNRAGRRHMDLAQAAD